MRERKQSSDGRERYGKFAERIPLQLGNLKRCEECSSDAVEACNAESGARSEEPSHHGNARRDEQPHAKHAHDRSFRVDRRKPRTMSDATDVGLPARPDGLPKRPVQERPDNRGKEHGLNGKKPRTQPHLRICR